MVRSACVPGLTIPSDVLAVADKMTERDGLRTEVRL